MKLLFVCLKEVERITTTLTLLRTTGPIPLKFLEMEWMRSVRDTLMMSLDGTLEMEVETLRLADMELRFLE